MNPFKSFRPILQCAAELRRIANALEYFATVDARTNRRFFMVNTRFKGKDESELLHTDDIAIAALRKEELEQFLQHGDQGDPDES